MDPFADNPLASVATLTRPLYSIGEAARLLRTPHATLRWWLEGRKRDGKTYPPVIRAEPTGGDEVTWAEFVEADLLRRYRGLGVPLQRMRPFIEAVRREFEIPYPLAHYRPLVLDRDLVLELQTETGLDRALYLIQVEGGQVRLAPPLREFLATVDFESGGVRRIRPLGVSSPVAIDPALSFGVPQIRGLRTETLVEAVLAGDPIEAVAEAWRVTREEIEAALAWEEQLQAA